MSEIDNRYFTDYDKTPFPMMKDDNGEMYSALDIDNAFQNIVSTKLQTDGQDIQESQS